MRLWIGIACALIISISALELVDRALPPPLDDVVVSAVVTDADGLPLRVFPVEDGRWRMAAHLDDIDPRFIEALILLEDKRFFEHGGTDPLAVLRAARDNVLRGRVVSGASTITMQTARLLEPRPRTFSSKLIEMFRAWQLERRLTKVEILELYLTLAPYGGNLEGLQTAAWAYFGTDTEQLSDSDIALLLALPQSPEARRPDLRHGQALAARKVILHRLADEGWTSVSRVEDLAEATLARRRHAFPAEAWHLTEKVVRRAPNTLHTNIDRQIQDRLQALIQQTAAHAGSSVQGSAMVVRLEDRAVVAAVGSAGRDRPGGWLDLTARRRSPGSTLKPLIYALAMQEGLVSPSTRVSDIPTAFGTYTPENFDRSFNGELTVATALQHSLNVPAVLILDAIGPERLVGALNLAGLETALPASKDRRTGLAVALGGLGVSAEDLVMLYAAIADEGLAKPLAYTASEAAQGSRSAGVRLLREEVANDIATILRNSPSPAGRLPADLTMGAPQIAFKTGTSYGYRDAWAVGFSDTHAAVVWLGRADGAPRKGETGRKAALPVLFDVFDAINPVRAPQSQMPKAISPTGPARVARNEGPVIIFPPDGATLWPNEKDKPLVLSGRADGPSWFVGGELLLPDGDGNLTWSPTGPGFYTITLTDVDGQETHSTIRMR